MRLFSGAVAMAPGAVAVRFPFSPARGSGSDGHGTLRTHHLIPGRGSGSPTDAFGD